MNKDIDLSKVKLSFKVNFIEDNSATISIIFIKSDCLNSGKSFHKNNNLSYTVWSWSDFYFDDTQFRLPDINNLSKALKVSKTFKNEEHRKDVFRKLYITLKEWADRLGDTKDSKIVLDGDNWFVI